MNMNDLPNELLDEIFSYVQQEIVGKPRMTPIQTVCRRWNRPYMTRILDNERLLETIDLQAKFPKLTCFHFNRCRGRSFRDFSLFKGHAFLKRLEVVYTGLVPSVLNCPRLTSLRLDINAEEFFDDERLKMFMTLLPRLETLDIHVDSGSYLDHELITSYNQKMTNIHQSRPKDQKLKLKHLTLEFYEADFTLFGHLFQTSSLDHFETYNEWKTPRQVRDFINLFPNLQSLTTYNSSVLDFNEVRFDHITSLKLVSRETLSFSSILHQFPNVESLDMICQIMFDLNIPTRFTHSKMSFTGTVQPRLFCHLKTLYWTIDSDQFNYLMQELATHCSNLESITMHQNTESIVPELDNIVFPLLVTLKLYTGVLEFNSSLAQFLARHGQLKKLELGNTVKFENNWSPIESDHVLWPSLRDFLIYRIHGDKSQRIQKVRDWFVKHAPNLKNHTNSLGCFC